MFSPKKSSVVQPCLHLQPLSSSLLPDSPLSLSPPEPAKPFPIIHHLHPIAFAWKFFPLIFTLWVLLVIQPSDYMSPLWAEFPYTILYCDLPVSIQQPILFPEKLLSFSKFFLRVVMINISVYYLPSCTERKLSESRNIYLFYSLLIHYPLKKKKIPEREQALKFC